VKPETNISGLADQCVKCGLCLPHCPTYRLFGNEADSPRGRIALMEGLDQGQLDPDATLLRHLDGCLSCQACEKSCPSGVRYSLLLDTTRDRLEARRPRPWHYRQLRRLGLWLAAHPRAWRRAWLALKVYQRSGLQALLRFSGLLRLCGLDRLESRLPPVHCPPLPATADDGTADKRLRVGLFTGCMESVVSATLLDDTQTLLQRLGMRTVIPATQACCGALHQHNGAVADARSLARRNHAAFADAQVTTALYLSSGCGVTLMPADDSASSPATAVQFVEAVQYIAAQPALTSLPFRPLPEAAAWFSPCSQRNVTGGEAATRTLLELIPGLRLLPLASDCCGAAGTYMLSQPDTAARLRSDVLAGLSEPPPRLLVTANVGCAIHLASGLRQQHGNIEVIHPLTLLRRQLADAEPGS
jgi:glycolate oxidase iron-sulfur subunit